MHRFVAHSFAVYLTFDLKRRGNRKSRTFTEKQHNVRLKNIIFAMRTKHRRKADLR